MSKCIRISEVVWFIYGYASITLIFLIFKFPKYFSEQPQKSIYDAPYPNLTMTCYLS